MPSSECTRRRPCFSMLAMAEPRGFGNKISTGHFQGSGPQSGSTLPTGLSIYHEVQNIFTKPRQTHLFMKPYPLFTLNHFTVPVTLVAGGKKQGEGVIKGSSCRHIAKSAVPLSFLIVCLLSGGIYRVIDDRLPRRQRPPTPNMPDQVRARDPSMPGRWESDARKSLPTKIEIVSKLRIGSSKPT